MVSIIVPVYNSSRFLKRCVESILDQSFQDYELILVNDGSSDNSGEICNNYAAMDSRIRVFHKKNGGVSSARNVGLDKARGEYISFVDSDDWIDERYLEELMTDSRFDFSICNYIVENSNNKIWESENCICVDSVSINEWLFKNFRLYLRTPWCKLYKRRIIEDYDIRFDDSFVSGEDTIFNIRYLNYINNLSFRKNKLYYYNVSNPDSLTANSVYDKNPARYINQIYKELNRTKNGILTYYTKDSLYFELCYGTYYKLLCDIIQSGNSINDISINIEKVFNNIPLVTLTKIQSTKKGKYGKLNDFLLRNKLYKPLILLHKLFNR